MAIEIILNSSESHIINQDLIEDAVQLTLNETDKADVDLTVHLTDDETIRKLNQTYRGFDKTTDVLAFNQDFINPESGQIYLGDVIISINQAQIQANENDQSLAKECALLTIHGTLHLLGYDHSDPEEKEHMWTIQDKIMKDLLSLSKEEKPK